MRFWDSSAIVPLLIDEATTSSARRELTADPGMVVWWSTELECSAAIARSEREGRTAGLATTNAFAALGGLRRSWVEIEPSGQLRDVAIRLTRTHPLRAADALQLAAATIAADGSPPELAFLTLDERLYVAAEREGFQAVRFDASVS